MFGRLAYFLTNFYPPKLPILQMKTCFLKVAHRLKEVVSRICPPPRRTGGGLGAYKKI